VRRAPVSFVSFLLPDLLPDLLPVLLPDLLPNLADFPFVQVSADTSQDMQLAVSP